MSGERSPSTFEYDVALSFASEQRSTAEQLFHLLARRNLRVFLDEYTGSEPWGGDVLDHLVNLYARKSRYCVLLVSQGFPLKTWTAADRKSVQERALRDAEEYILPLLVDDSFVPGLAEAGGYKDLRQLSPENIADFLEKKLADARAQAGPPAKSHDLRSGNVPGES